MNRAIRSIQRRIRSSVMRREGMERAGFTLVELMVAIVVIGILAGLVFGALQRASTGAKIVHTKSTIAKLNASLMDRWDSYRTRKLPIDPRTILQTMKTTGGAYPFVAQQIGLTPPAPPEGSMITRRNFANDALATPSTSSAYPSNFQVAAVRLLAMRELMQYEIPGTFADFADMGGTPGSFQPRKPNVLTNWPIPNPPFIPPVAQAYLRTLNAATTTDKNAIVANQSAECLYMILTVGSTDSALFGEQLPTDDVGDVDGDGLPEFQDAWLVVSNSYTPKGKANSPIDFLRWAPGFEPDLQPSLTDLGAVGFSMKNHDYFDPLKLDVPSSASGPRGYQLLPLIYSAGPDGSWGINYGPPGMYDPYDSAGYQNGQWAGAADSSRTDADNITNHDLDTRTGR